MILSYLPICTILCFWTQSWTFSVSSKFLLKLCMLWNARFLRGGLWLSLCYLVWPTTCEVLMKSVLKHSITLQYTCSWLICKALLLHLKQNGTYNYWLLFAALLTDNTPVLGGRACVSTYHNSLMTYRGFTPILDTHDWGQESWTNIYAA